VLTRRTFLAQSGRRLAAASLAGASAGTLLDAYASSSSSAASGSAAALTSASLQFSWVKDAEFAGYYIADKQGLFTKQGLNVSMMAGGPNVTSEQVVTSGRALIGLDSTDFITQARNQGAPLVAIGACFQKNPLGIMSLKSKNITKPRDLIGKKLGIPNGEQIQVTTFLKLNGINASDVHFEPYGTDPTPIANGDLDAALAFVTTDPYLLLSKGLKTNVFTLADYGYAVYNDCPYVTEDTLKNHRDTLIKFMRATILGWQSNIANPRYVVPLIINNYGKSLGFTYNSQYFQNVTQIPLMQSAATKAHGLFWMDPRGIAENMKTIAAAGIKPDKAVFNTSILEAVYGGAKRL
jgi:ABC-type nitrate/sulfonate/bicarbonate transport system substrate-binding protein